MTDLGNAMHAVADENDVVDDGDYVEDYHFSLRFLPWNSSKPLGGMR